MTYLVDLINKQYYLREGKYYKFIYIYLYTNHLATQNHLAT